MATLTLILVVFALVTSMFALVVSFNVHKKAALQDAPSAAPGLTSENLDDAVQAKVVRIKKYIEKYYALKNDVEGDYATKEELKEGLKKAMDGQSVALPPPPPAAIPDTSVLERRADRATSALKGIVEYLKALHVAKAASRRAPIDAEIASLEAIVAQDRKGLVPIQEKCAAAKKALSDLKQIKMPENPSEEEIEREADVFVRPLKLATSKERMQAKLDYFDARPEKVRQHKDSLEAAKTELDEASKALNEFRASTEAVDAEKRIVELRRQLAGLDEADKAIANLEKAVGISVILRKPAPRPEAVMTVDEDEFIRDSVPDMTSLVQVSMSSLPPPGRLPKI